MIFSTDSNFRKLIKEKGISGDDITKIDMGVLEKVAKDIEICIEGNIQDYSSLDPNGEISNKDEIPFMVYKNRLIEKLTLKENSYTSATSEKSKNSYNNHMIRVSNQIQFAEKYKQVIIDIINSAVSLSIDKKDKKENKEKAKPDLSGSDHIILGGYVNKTNANKIGGKDGKYGLSNNGFYDDSYDY